MTTVAQTIMDQINSMNYMIFPAWGAKEFVDMGNGLKFKTSGFCKFKGYVFIKYDEGRDTYTVEFFKIRKLSIVSLKTFEDVYVDQLIDIIDDYVR